MFGIMFFQPELSPLESLLEGYRKSIANLPFECDGLVLKIIDMRHRQELGESNTAPKWAVAFKYPPQRVRTKLLDIKLSVGRTGRICPNAVLEPIVVAGTEVSASTLHNADQVRRLGINVGDDIWLQKAGEIIPEIVGRASDLPVNYAGCLDTDDRALAKQAAEDAHAWVMPSHFTDSTGAKHEIIRNEGEVVHKLKNPGACVDCAHAQLKHMTGKTCLDWDGLGAEHCWTLVTSGVRNLFSLMVIDPASTGLKGKVLERFKASRETARSAPLWRVLYALAPEGIGRTYSKQLAALYVNSESVSALDLETLTKLLGPDAGQTLHAELPAIAREFIALKTIGFVLDDAALSGTTGPRPLQGMAFCITGTMSIPREEMAAEIERAGGLCKSSCGKSTTYLLVGDDPGATKVKAAEKHGVKMINEQDLLKLIKA
jgi:DNA ligase (NAD+)